MVTNDVKAIWTNGIAPQTITKAAQDDHVLLQRPESGACEQAGEQCEIDTNERLMSGAYVILMGVQMSRSFCHDSPMIIANHGSRCCSFADEIGR